MLTASKDWVERFQIFHQIQSKQLHTSTHSHFYMHTKHNMIKVRMGSVYDYYDVQQEEYRLHYSFPLQISQMNFADVQQILLCSILHMIVPNCTLNGNLSSEWVVLNCSRLGIIHSGSGFLSHISVWFIDRCYTFNHIELYFPHNENKIMQGF